MEEGQKAGVQSVSAPLQRRRASYTYTDPLDDESEEALWSYLDEKPSDCVVALLSPNLISSVRRIAAPASKGEDSDISPVSLITHEFASRLSQSTQGYVAEWMQKRGMDYTPNTW